MRTFFRRLNIFSLAVILIIFAAGYYGWVKISSPWGDQKVEYQPAVKNCDKVDDLKYCVYRAAQGVNGNVIYYMHGRNLDESSWNDETYYTAMLQRYWQRRDLKPPLVVALSFGPSWILTPKGLAPQSGLLPKLRSQLDLLESRIGPIRSRILLGESMGGLNVLAAGLSESLKVSRLASLCPGLYVDSPFSAFATLRKAIVRTGADPKIAYGVIRMIKSYVESEKEWNEFNPLTTIETTQARPEIYVSCGLYDNYGNFEGAEAFSTKAERLGFRVQWHPLYGGHCAIDIASLGEFLLKD